MNNSNSTLKLGINLAFVRKRWTSPEEWFSIVKEKLGLEYVEFCSDLLDPVFVSEPTRSRLAAEIKSKAEEYGLQIVDYCTGMMPHCINLLSHPDPEVRQDGFRWCEGAVKVAAKMGARGIGGHFDAISFRDWSDENRYEFYIAGLIQAFRGLSKLAGERGLEFILWEQMYVPGEVPYTIDQAEEVYRRTNEDAGLPVYLLVDIGHACCQNYPHKPQDRDPYTWLRRLAPISPVIHIHQTTADASCHWPFTREYNEAGIIRPEKVIEAINSSGSKENYLVFEVFHPLAADEGQVLDELSQTVEYWRRHVEE
ncbi:MAG TPA: sugar phosphate isomerase/epimerase [Candidatus Latescibacteria bacterium]|nr:sugar phosphate isomerase/epimerase [Candidatus Latescibacterota bacterium]